MSGLTGVLNEKGKRNFIGAGVRQFLPLLL